MRWEAALHGCGTNLDCLLYARETVFQLYHGGDVMYEMRRRKPGATVILTQGIFNLQHHIGMVDSDGNTN